MFYVLFLCANILIGQGFRFKFMVIYYIVSYPFLWGEILRCAAVKTILRNTALDDSVLMLQDGILWGVGGRMILKWILKKS